MTNLIYRGFPHAPTTRAAARTPRPLMYRGVAHDGIAPRAARFAGPMTYRGVAYNVPAGAEGFDVAGGAALPA